MKKQSFSTLDLVYCALGAVLIAVCSWISIPTTVPFTMQTFAVFCVLALLGGKRGLISVCVYIGLGAIGAPVFAGFKGGLAVLFGTTGGYILGFLLTAGAYWLASALLGEHLWVQLGSLLIGLMLCYVFGTSFFVVVYTATKGTIALSTALAWCVFPFIVPDLIKLVLSLLLAKRLKKLLRIR